MNQERKEGLPDIADLTSRRNILFMIMSIVVLIIVLGIYFYPQHEKKSEKVTEETYATQPVVQVETKKEIPIVAQPTAVEATAVKEVDPAIIQQKIDLMQQKQKELQQRLIAPIMVVQANQANSAVSNAQPITRDVNTQFMNQVSAQTAESVTATNIGPLNSIIAQGNFIHAVLEPAINSDLPGDLRASVSVPVYSEDGSQVLIPPGSRLIGQYKSGILQGQSRIFIVWTRLITPSGLSLQLGSSGVDSLGVAGMEADEINRHFWERFSTASLLSLIGAGAANVGVTGQDQNNSASLYREAVANSFAQSADQALQQDNRIAPTLKIYQGKPIMVFIARDLHFNQAMQSVKSKINIF
ncbi:MAG: hypothetical protein JO149_01935 [Gammaproteobacteria bacterium]|nr:hypothetical protein [Gammaproteobacteria bacterium]